MQKNVVDPVLFGIWYLFAFNVNYWSTKMYNGTY